jgi:hypothetical protein
MVLMGKHEGKARYRLEDQCGHGRLIQKLIFEK